MQRIKKQQELPHYKADRSVTRCAGGSEHTEQLSVHPTTGASPNKLMLGRELRGKLPEARRQTEHPDDAKVRKRDREQKEKMKKYADKRIHTAAMRNKVGDTS